MRESPRPPRLPGALWGRLAIVSVAALIVVALVPRAWGGGASPPALTLLAVGLLVTVATAWGLYFGITRDLAFPTQVALYAVGYNALVIAIKFVLAPMGLYEVNRSGQPVEAFLLLNRDLLGALLTVVPVFLLYFAVYAIIYRIFRRRVRELIPARVKRIPTPVVVGVVAGTFLLAGAWLGAIVILAFAGGTAYLDFVFTSSISLLVALALAGAIYLATRTFGSVTDRARVVGDVAVLVSFFWLGLYFLALYHVLWVVYILILTSIWPLKVVIPK